MNSDEVEQMEGGGETKDKTIEADKIESQKAKAWTPNDGLAENEVLEVDESAYKMLHNVNLEWPSLSFDFISDDLGNNRTRFPHTISCVVGSQADSGYRNSVTVIKMESLGRVPKVLDENADSDNEGNDSDDDSAANEVEEDPILQFQNIPHDGGVNRIRFQHTTSESKTKFVATWSDNRKVYIYDIREHLDSLNSATTGKVSNLANRPVFAYNGHTTEGYAMDWHPKEPQKLLTGDCHGGIHYWQPQESSFSAARFFKPNRNSNNSVEDLVWSPTEGTVFAAGDTDGTIRIFDTRAPNKCMLTQHVSSTDVNVLAWSKHVTNLLASGCEDGSLSVWDLRTFTTGKSSPLARFTYSQTPITSVEWHPTDESMLCATDDNATYLYDLSIEDDEQKTNETNNKSDVPPQLLFLHCGSEMVKEAHWHKQIPSCVMTTSLSGLSVFIPSNL